jgi:glycosyltransferase involved in cell wall biosynthesis
VSGAAVSAEISVALATLDRPDRAKRCLEAVLAGEVVPAEVIVVDQGTDDRTARMVAALDSSRVPVVHVRQHRRGLSAARNLGLQLATCDIVAVTDDDCVPSPDWLAQIASVLSAPDAPDAVTGRVLALGPAAAGTYPVATREGTVRRQFRPADPPWTIGSGNNWAIRRNWYLRVGGCDEALGVGSSGHAAEDIDLFYRLIRAGAVVRYEPSVLVYHERQGREQRLRSRYTYGHGVGAFCSLRLRARDGRSVRVLASWLRWQGSELIRAAARRDWNDAHERARSLVGTAGGVAYGLRAPQWRGASGSDGRLRAELADDGARAS